MENKEVEVERMKAKVERILLLTFKSRYSAYIYNIYINILLLFLVRVLQDRNGDLKKGHILVLQL